MPECLNKWLLITVQWFARIELLSVTIDERTVQRAVESFNL